MTVNELKNHLMSHINIQSDFMILNRYISENKFEELDFPSRSLKDLNNHEIIHISIGVALHDGQYRGTIFLLEYSKQTHVSYHNNTDYIKNISIFNFKFFAYRSL